MNILDVVVPLMAQPVPHNQFAPFVECPLIASADIVDRVIGPPRRDIRRQHNPVADPDCVIVSAEGKSGIDRPGLSVGAGDTFGVPRLLQAGSKRLTDIAGGGVFKNACER